MTSSTAPFGRVLTAMVTPFKADGSVDLEAVERLATHLVDHGNDGIVVSGTTGEAPTTTTAEDGEILAAVVAAVGDRATVVAGVGTNNTAHSIELIQQAERRGAHGALLVSPYYNRPTQAGIAAHLEAVTAASDLRVMLYDIPARTGVTVAPETYARVAADERIVAVKDAVGDIFRGVKIAAETGLALYSGDDVLNLAWLTHGAAGIVSVVGHIAGEDYAAMVAALESGDLPGALASYLKVLPLVDVIMNRAPGVMTTKAALELMGVLAARDVRLPHVPADQDLVDAIEQVLRSGGWVA